MEKKPVTKGEAPGRGFPFSLLIIGLILQFIWYFTFFGRLGRSYPWMNTLLLAAAFILVLGIYNADTSPSVKMPYIILLLSLPLIGVPLFILIWTSPGTWLMKRRFAAITKQVLSRLDYQEASSAALCRADKNAYNLSEYIYRYSGYPLYHNTHITYFDNALSAFREQLEALKKARRFIFMEYHAIEDASSFQELHEILAAKVKEGVEVRLFYDEVGSLSFIDRRFIRKMEAGGIACRVFNPISPLLNLFLNHRDHRKITVIDGLVGFTGGYNLADEYFNIVQPYGHWKDTGLKITGPAVSNLTAAFLEVWNGIRPTDMEEGDSLSRYFPKTGTAPRESAKEGFVQPYADTPLDGETLGENVYIHLISTARDYVYLMTPYLIISSEMQAALTLAAKKGVDVRIITPGIPDKKMIFGITRSYYEQLQKAGVSIYEYSPGFCHAKQCLADDVYAVCGTINLDARSLYHHFENAVFYYDSQAVLSMKEDFLRTFSLSERITERMAGRPMRRLLNAFLRLLAPLL